RRLPAAAAGDVVRDRRQGARVRRTMPTEIETLARRGRAVDGHRPWPRYVVQPDAWRAAAELAANGGATLLGLWSDVPWVHMALIDERRGDVAVFSLDCPDQRFP